MFLRGTAAMYVLANLDCCMCPKHAFQSISKKYEPTTNTTKTFLLTQLACVIRISRPFNQITSNYTLSNGYPLSHDCIKREQPAEVDTTTSVAIRRFAEAPVANEAAHKFKLLTKIKQRSTTFWITIQQAKSFAPLSRK